MAVGAVIARIISQYSDKGSKAAQKDIAKLGKNIDAFAKKVTKSFAIATAASAAFAAKIGTDAVKGAIDDQKSVFALTKTLENVTGVTKEAIAATEEYIRQQEKITNVEGPALRESLSALVVATGDLTTATDLQSIALDVAAGTGKDLQSVTMAMVKAQQGNLGALKKLGVPLDDTIVKNKDLGAALTLVSDKYEGQAKLLGDADPLTRLKNAYNEVLDTLGYALLPTVQKFTEYVISNVLPTLEEWIRVNEEDLQKSLDSVFSLFKLLLDNGQTLTKTLQVLVSISEFLNSSIFGVIKWGEALLGIFVIGRLGAGLSKIFGGISLEALVTGKRFDVVAKKGGLLALAIKGIATAIKLVGKAFLALPGPIKLLVLAGIAIGATLKFVKNRVDDVRKANERAAKATYEFEAAQRLSTMAQKDAILAGFKAIEVAVEATRRKERLAKIEAANRKRELEDAAKQAKIQAGLNKLKALGIKGEIKEDDPIQLEAARLLLVKQNNLLELEKLKRMKDEINLMKVRNDLAKRYDDILTALADNEISTKEVAILAEKWGVTKEAVDAYLIQFFAVSDGKIDDDEVTKLAKAWGSTEDQARQYLQFVNFLNDGILSDYEIQELMKNWGLTEQEVRKYASFVAVVNDGKLNDSEVQKLMDQWNLTTDEVVDYIKKIGSPVTYSGTLIDPAKAAEIAWNNATAALQRYLDLLKNGTGTTTQNPIIPPVVIPPVIPPIVPPSHDGTIVSDAAAAAEKVAEEIKTLTELRKDTESGTGINFLLKEHIDALKDNTSVFSNIPVVDEQTKLRAMGMFGDPIPSNFDVGSFRMAENRDFVSTTLSNASGIDEQSKYRAMNNIVVNVQGSVTTEQDLVSAVRNGLLQTQYNGNQVLLQAI